MMHHRRHGKAKRRNSGDSTASASSDSEDSVGSPLPSRPLTAFSMPTEAYLLANNSNNNKSQPSPPSGVTYLVKILTFVLLGFAGGLLYHLTQDQHTLSNQEQLLQANDHIVQELASQNQQHTRELQRLRETTQNLRNRNQLIADVVHKAEHPEDDPHALLWSNDVHQARLEAAQQQAEALLRLRHAHDEE